jgi:hypothetical protein
MTTHTKRLTIAEAQDELQKLAEEEQALPSRIEAKTLELARAQHGGDFQRAAVLSEEIKYIAGPRAGGIQEERS